MLTLLTGYLLFAHFSAKGTGKGGTKSAARDTAAGTNQFRIAYFEMDSVANNFELVKQVKNELAKKESENTAEIERMAKELQQRYNYYQKKANDGTITEDESKNAGEELKRLDDAIKLRKQQLDQDYFDYKTRRENEVKKNIESFIKKYNEGRNFTYIMSYEPGLFYYRDTALNITADVVKGLNVEFAPGKKK